MLFNFSAVGFGLVNSWGVCFNRIMRMEVEIDDVKVEIIRKRVKNLQLTVRPPSGEVRLSVPLLMDYCLAEQFLLSKLKWIKKQQRRIQKYVYEPAPPYVDPKILQQQLQQLVPAMVAQWEPRLNVRVNRLSYRKMTTRWGSCTPDDASIRLNLELARKSIELLEYVVVHEMIHLLEPSHNARFVGLMDQYLPDWRERKKRLNGRRT